MSRHLLSFWQEEAQAEQVSKALMGSWRKCYQRKSVEVKCIHSLQPNSLFFLERILEPCTFMCTKVLFHPQSCPGLDKLHSYFGQNQGILAFFLLSTPAISVGWYLQLSSVAQSCMTLRSHGLQHARPPCPSLQELKLMSIELVMPSNHLILCSTLLLPPSIFPSIRVFSNESALCIRWPKYWSFSFNISPSNEYSGLISFRMDWLDLLAVRGTLKSLLQHHSSKASILRRSAFFIVQLSHPYMTTG